MIRNTVFAICVVMIGSVLFAHDMWLEPEQFLLQPGQRVVVRNGNGTIYQKSENAVDPERISGLVGIGPAGRRFTPGSPSVQGPWLEFFFAPETRGNYWLGLATRPRLIRMSGKDFTEYLEHDGIPSILKERAEKGISDRDEVEQYSKYVKTFLEVGGQTSGNHTTPLGLTIEIVPLENPYRLQAGDALPVRVLFRGKPLAGLLLHAGVEGESHQLSEGATGEDGSASIRLARAGKWYIRGIHLSQVDSDDHSYESYWATLTFQVK